MRWTGRFKTGGLFGNKLLVQVVRWTSEKIPSPFSTATAWMPLTQDLLREISEEFLMLRDRLEKLGADDLPAPPQHVSNIHLPISDDQQKIVEELLKNRELRQKLQKGFACGGPFNRRAEGRFGEVPSERTRAGDVYAFDEDYADPRLPARKYPDSFDAAEHARTPSDTLADWLDKPMDKPDDTKE